MDPTGAEDYVCHSQDEIEQGYSEDPYFVVTPSGEAVQFYTRLDAPTTNGSKYPRSELRELHPDGTKMGFDASAGTHRLSGTSRITHLPPVKRAVVIAQLHNGERDRVAIRTDNSNGDIRLHVRINGTHTGEDLENPYTIGTEFSWMIEIQDGDVNVYYVRGTSLSPLIRASADPWT